MWFFGFVCSLLFGVRPAPAGDVQVKYGVAPFDPGMVDAPMPKYGIKPPVDLVEPTLPPNVLQAKYGIRPNPVAVPLYGVRPDPVSVPLYGVQPSPIGKPPQDLDGKGDDGVPSLVDSWLDPETPASQRQDIVAMIKDRGPVAFRAVVQLHRAEQEKIKQLQAERDELKRTGGARQKLNTTNLKIREATKREQGLTRLLGELGPKRLQPRPGNVRSKPLRELPTDGND